MASFPRAFLPVGLLGIFLAGCGEPIPGEMAFDAATSRILGSSKETAFGNKPEARELAERFGSLLRNKLSDKKEGSGRLGKAPFLTYCELQEDRVCFLVRVGELSRFEGEARAALIQSAWSTATAVTKGLRSRKDRKLGVGLRGKLVYGGLALGMGNEEPTTEQGFTVRREALYEFFAEESIEGQATSG